MWALWFLKANKTEDLPGNREVFFLQNNSGYALRTR